jgi:hypothetical protein
MSLPSIDSTHTPPGRADVRSPCPGLNTLANHGILPHDGRDITPDMLVQAMTSTFHMSEGLARFFANGSRAVASNPLTGKINLDDLNRHNVLEHDASLSRADAGERPGGDNHSFNKTIFDGFMAHYAGMEHTTLEAAAKARHDRFLEGKASDESFRFGAKEYTLSYGETALYLQVLGGAKAARAKVEHVRVFFGKLDEGRVEGVNADS